jgi:fructokinase
MSYGGIEAGGTKWVCALGDGGAAALATASFPTTTPAETIARAVRFFSASRASLEAIGIGSFGPIDVRRDSPTWGHITTTPKPGWAHTDLAGPLGDALGLPVAFDTDVNAAALAEWRSGAAVGLDTVCYITVGTGIGGGGVADGRLLHGLIHPELGHMRIPHDRARDPFAGCCPFHGDCLEGLASGTAIRERWGAPGDELSRDPAVWELEGEYLALGLVNVIYTLSPQRIVLGGGVMRQPDLLGRIHRRLPELLGGYLDAVELTAGDGIERYIVAPGLGDLAGVLGAIELARRIAARQPQGFGATSGSQT